MIKLVVNDLCHDCPAFEVETRIHTGYMDKRVFEIRCSNYEKCNQIKDYLERKMLNGG